MVKSNSPKELRTTILNPELLDEGRNRIVRAAIRVFAKKGYALSTTRELAGACGMSEAAMYRYVGSKRDILALISLSVETFFIKLRDYEKGLTDVSRAEALCACWRYYLSYVDREQDLIIIMHRETLHFAPDVNARRMGRDPSGMTIFEKILGEGVACGEFECDDPKQMAFDMWILAHEWALKRWLLRRYFTLERYTEWHLKNLLKVLAVSKDHVESNREEMEQVIKI